MNPVPLFWFNQLASFDVLTDIDPRSGSRIAPAQISMPVVNREPPDGWPRVSRSQCFELDWLIGQSFGYAFRGVGPSFGDYLSVEKLSCWSMVGRSGGSGCG